METQEVVVGRLQFTLPLTLQRSSSSPGSSFTCVAVGV
ncbi:hypothetical protein A2U01_0013772, partial [Trifolium medium]|nr:hypothetical protein [Trifolium medium]